MVNGGRRGDGAKRDAWLLLFLFETLSYVSTRSTINVTVQDADNVLLLHVFNERLILKDEFKLSQSDADVAVVDRSRHSYFSDRYFVVMIERVKNVNR